MLPETELVIALSRTPLRDSARNRVRRLLGNGIDWNAVMRVAARWQVEPTVLGNLRSDYSGAMPPEVFAEVAASEQRSRAYALARTLVLIDLVKSLEHAGISVIVLKGPAVAIAAYGDYSRRIFDDIDLLVPRTDIERARDALLARGFGADFRPEMEDRLISAQHALEFSNSRTRVELHWALLSRHLHFDLDVDELWTAARQVRCAGSDISVLAPEHLFIYLCAHGAKHEWMLFRWICDLAQVEQRLSATDAAKIVALAERTHTKRILALGLRVVRETFGDEESPFLATAFLPARDTLDLAALVMARLTSDGKAPRLLPERLARVHPYLAPLVFWIRSRERMRDRVACAARFVFIPTVSDVRSGPFDRVLRPARLAANALRRAVHAS